MSHTCNCRNPRRLLHGRPARTHARRRTMPCPHGRQRNQCKECGGSGICEHGRVRSKCKDCGGGSICEHGQRRSRCKDCGGGGHVTIVEATEVEEFDGEEDPDEWVPTVQARLVRGPRGGGKRKR